MKGGDALFENLRLAIQGIWSHKMRSFLTMLGIIIGIASIIAIVSTIQGTSEQIKNDLIGAGQNLVKITLYDGDSEMGTYGGQTSNAPILTEDQKKKVRRLENVVNATFFYTRSYSSVYYLNKSFQGGTVLGIDLDYLDTYGYMVQTGRGFVQRDYDTFSKVALVDTYVVENLFLGEDPIGKVLEIEQQPFTIIGIITQPDDYLPKMSSISDYEEYMTSMVGSILIPDKCWPIPYQFDESQNVAIKADSTDNMSSAGKSTADILNAGIDNKTQKTNFQYKADDIMERVRSMQKLSESTSQQLIWIASISLLVGGIGVMNIMLVSVTERTREIGLKKAIGARKKTILRQFLTEASMLTSIGGLIGVGSGIGLSKIVARITGTPSAISVPAIVGSVVFSTLIGVIFGLMPSVKAANLNPIDALRSE